MKRMSTLKNNNNDNTFNANTTTSTNVNNATFFISQSVAVSPMKIKDER